MHACNLQAGQHAEAVPRCMTSCLAMMYGSQLPVQMLVCYTAGISIALLCCFVHHAGSLLAVGSTVSCIARIDFTQHDDTEK